MSLERKIAAMVEHLPPGSSLTLPADWVRAELDIGSDVLADLTVEEAAQELSRAPSTVRAWLIAGELRGYKVHGREWRVSPAAIREFFENQRNGSGRLVTKTNGKATDLAAWRNVKT